MTTPHAMTLLQLAMHLAKIPEREELRTPFEREVIREYDRRVLALEAGAAA